MDPEVQALIAVYQKRLADVTAQAIAYEARISILAKQIQELTQQPPAPQPPAPQKKTPKVRKTDGGTFWVSINFFIITYVFISKQMHNREVSYNNLRAWTAEGESLHSNDPIDDYFECISECNPIDKQCITSCRTLL